MPSTPQSSNPPDRATNSPANAPQTPQPNRVNVSARLEQLEKRQAELWRITYFLLLILAAAFLWTSWPSLRAFVFRLEGAAIGLVALLFLFGVYAWRRTRDISELRGLVRGLEQREASPNVDRHLDQLISIVSRSQQGYRDLIDSFDDILLAISLDGEIRAANRRFTELVGQSFQEIIGKKLTEFLDESGGQGSSDALAGLPRFLERRHWTGVVQVRLKNRNSVHYFDLVAHAMLRDDAVHGITVLARDVTALRRNEARFTELFETLQEGIYIVTPENQILDANPALVRILGYDSKEELLAKKVSDIFPDESLRTIVRAEVDRQPVVEGREITLVRKDGSPIFCLNTAAAVRDSNGVIIRYQGCVMDITARREIERRLHKQQEFARRLVDNFPDLILVIDSHRNYTFISPRCKDVLGYDLEDTQEMQFGGRTHPEDLPGLLALYDEILQGRCDFSSQEIRVRHKLGEWRRILFNFSPLSDEKGKIEGVVLSGRDITEIKRMGEQLVQAEKLAAIGQMLAGVAHELNNPLTAILGVTELLRERKSTDDEAKRQLDLTHRQARRAARIVQNLLEFSRPTQTPKQPIDIGTVLERTLQLHEHSLRRNAIETSMQLPPDLPLVIADSSQLVQVFLNLLINAEQAIREIRESGRIQIRAAKAQGHVAITVQDDGPGIPPDVLSKIFDPFFTTKRPGGGTGLGLSICVSILREHGGTIEAQSLPAGGSAFTVLLPAAKSVGGVAPREVIEERTKNDSPVKRILVLDDEESIRALLEEGLGAQGLLVKCAANAEQAVKLAGAEKFDAVLCDLNLGGGASSGQEAAANICAVCGATKPLVIFMTGELAAGQKGHGEFAGSPFLQKPFRIATVVALLRESLDAIPSLKK